MTNTITGTGDPALYQVQRAASTTTAGTSFSYNITGIVNGSYTLSLYFAEIEGQSRRRAPV